VSATKLYGIQLAYIYPCKTDWWGRPLSRENLTDTEPPLAKTPIFNLFSHVRFSH